MEATLLRHLFSTVPAELLIASIWQGLLLTAFAWSVIQLTGSLRASTRFTLWLIVFALIALLPCFAIAREMFLPNTFVPDIFGAHLRNSAMIAAHSGFSLHIPPAWAFALETAWVVTSLFSLTRLFLSGKQMIRLLRTSTSVPFASLSDDIQTLLSRTGLRTVELRLSGSVDAPIVLGFLHPAIVVPAALSNELSPQELKQIVLHEMAHLHRGDDWTNLLQKLLRACSPLNPALVWAERHLCREREQACDDAVLAAAGDARAYASCLTRLAENRLVRQAALLAPGLFKRRSELAGRVENILRRRRRLDPRLSRGLVAASLVASLAGVLALQLCPRLITFAGDQTLTAAAAPQPLQQGSDAYIGAEQSSYKPASYQQGQQQPRLEQAVFYPRNESPSTQQEVKQSAKPALKKNSQAKVRAAHSQRLTARHAKLRNIAAHSDAPTLRYLELRTVAAHKDTPALRYLQLRSVTEDSDAGVTLIFFTVQVRSTAAQPRIVETDMDMDQPNLANPDNWIVFQI